MMSMMGVDPEDILTDEEVTKLLAETFKKFDNSGFIDKSEFIKAIKGSRVEELSLGLLLTKMDGHLDGLAGFFESYKRRYEEAQAKQKDAFEVLRMSARRRRVLKQQMTQRIEKTVHDIVVQLEAAQGTEAQVDEDYKMYMTLKDTFNAFDRDGNAELQFPEYMEAWKFLQQPGTEKEIKGAFDSVDIDGSGMVQLDEFMFSIMGKKAMKYGPLADLEKLDKMLQSTLGDYLKLSGSLVELKEANEARANKNALLREKLDGMRNEVTSQMNGMFENMFGLDPSQILSDDEIRKHMR